MHKEIWLGLRYVLVPVDIHEYSAMYFGIADGPFHYMYYRAYNVWVPTTGAVVTTCRSAVRDVLLDVIALRACGGEAQWRLRRMGILLD